MSLRDAAITLIVFGAIPLVLMRPHLGVLVYTWLSLMNPHRLTWGFAFNFPFAAVMAGVTMVALIISREPKRFPVTPATVCLILFVIWMCVSTLFALNPEGAWIEWKRAMKIQLMVLVTMMLIQNRERLNWYVWVIVVSIGFYGVKGGIFAAVTRAEFMVWGPPGSFIEDNTSMALALIMVLPLMRYLQLSAQNKWVRRGLTVAMLLSGFAVLASYSRGAFLALAAMCFFLLLKTRHKALVGVLMLLAIPVLLIAMPEKWYDRISSIQTYQQDASAMGRINAWYHAYNVAKDHPLVGGGYDVFTPELFLRYAPDPMDVHDAHSIFFEVLGEHGFVGLGLYLLLMWLVWRTASWTNKRTRDREDLIWARDLSAMTQAALVGYAVGGAFLGLAYFDLYYNLVALIVLTQMVVRRILDEETKKPGLAPRPAMASVFPGDRKTGFGNSRV